MSKPLFTKRHYNFIVKLLRDNKKHIDMPPTAVRDMLERFRADNPRFDAMKFVRELGDGSNN